MRKFAALLSAGIDNVGADTVLQQFDKFLSTRPDVEFIKYAYYKNLYGASKKDGREMEGVKLIKSFIDPEFIKDINSSEVIFIIASPNQKLKSECSEFIEMLKQITAKKIMFHIGRSNLETKMAIYLPEVQQNIDLCNTLVGPRHPLFKKLSDIQSLDKMSQIDINLYNFDSRDPVKLQDRNNYISYIGRITTFKGAHKMIDWYEQGLFPKGYIYNMQGADFKYNRETNQVSGGWTELYHLSNFGKDGSHNKRDCIELYDDYSSYNNQDENKLHIFPNYKIDEMKERVRHNRYVFMPHRYNASRGKDNFYTGLEYATLEVIDMGTPVIFIDTFGNEFMIDGKPLSSYDCGLIFVKPDMSDIKERIAEYEKDYDNNTIKMRNFFKHYCNNLDRLNQLLEKVNIDKLED